MDLVGTRASLERGHPRLTAYACVLICPTLRMTRDDVVSAFYRARFLPAPFAEPWR